MRICRLLGLLALLPLGCGALGGCQLERLFPEQVAPGVARLTVRSVATLASLVDQDTTCGFASEAVSAGFTVDGEIGGPGTVTWRVEGCVLDFGALREVSRNCNDEVTEAGGRVVVDAVRSVTGTLTGNPAQPVIPAGPDAVKMTFDVEAADFEVRLSGKDNALTIEAGRLSFVALPHLAKSASQGLCAVSTSDVTLEDIAYQDARVILESDGRVFPVEVPASRFDAQVGAYGGRENWFSGAVTVWDQPIAVPVADEDPALDPDYDAEAFRASYACKADLEVPVSYGCDPLLPRVAQGAAQLTVSAFGNLASLVDDRCFLVPEVAGLPEVAGEVGHAGGEARYTLDEPCVLELPEPTPIREDCHGTITYAEGRLSATGTKVVRGIVTGDPREPIVPTSDEPGMATVRLELEEGFTLSDSASDRALVVRRGVLSGTTRPRTALDVATGACSIKTPIVTFEGLSWEDASLLVVSDGNTLGIDIESASLEAQNGPRGARENYLAGTVVSGGETVTIPIEGAPVLDPGYDRERFLAGFTCDERLRLVESGECSFARTLGENAARLLTLTAGTLASRVNADDDCGFESTWVLISPSEVVGEPGEMGSMSWEIEACEIGDDTLSLYATDCAGGRTFVRGRATVDARRTVEGERDTTLVFVDSIVPRDREAVEIELRAAILDEVVTYQVAPGASLPAGMLTLHTGTLSARVQPLLGERESEPGTFDVPTPVAILHEIRLDDGEATLEAAGKTFHLALDDVSLSARAGVYQGEGNQVSGSLRVNGTLITLGALPLNPDYDQASFDESYACTEDLREPLPPQ